MIRFLTDQNFDNRILRGLLRRAPTCDAARVQDLDLSTATDPVLLAAAAAMGRVLLTHDVSTVTAHAHEHVRKREPMPGVIEVPRSLPIGAAIEDLVLIFECSNDGEWEGRVLYLPF
jgi:hypothetical protein